jgi:hypothetical protein
MTERAWRRLEETLTTRLVALTDGECLVLEVDEGQTGGDESCAPCAHVACADGLLTAQVAGNRRIGVEHRLSERAQRRLRDLGRHEPSDGTAHFWVVRAPRYADRLAHQMVSALRDVFDVADPAALTGDMTRRKTRG